MEKVYQISKTNIFVRLNKWALNLDYSDFSHMCPFFWVSVLVFLLSPIVLVAKVIIFIYKKLSKYKSMLDASWESKETEKLLTIPEYYREFTKKIDFKNCEGLYHDLYWNLMYSHLELHKKISSYRWILEEEKEKKSLENKKKINKIVKVSKAIFQPFLYILAFVIIVGTAWAIFSLFYYLFTFDYGSINYKSILISSLYMVSTLFILYLVYRLLRNVNFAKPFIWIGSKFSLFFNFIYEMYKASCPAIKWKD